MEITLKVSGRNVTFRKSGATMFAYKQQTGRNFYSDLSAFMGCVKLDKKGKPIIKNGIPVVDMDKFDMDYMYYMIHVMAKSADSSVPSDMLEWLDSFDDFNVLEIFCKLLPMLENEMKIDEKNSLTAAGGTRRKAT